MKQKLTSRKFITALTGIITGILLIVTGSISEGASTLAASVAAYCFAEGIVDKNRVNTILQKMDTPTEESEETH